MCYTLNFQKVENKLLCVLDLISGQWLLCVQAKLSGFSELNLKLVRSKMFCDYFHFPIVFIECRLSFHELIVAFNFSPIQQGICVCAWEAEP